MVESTSEILFEKFEVIECLKKDEHAAVYLANHIYLGKKIILKALNTETIPDDSKIERFKREAKILAKLEHPNIIKVLDFGTHKEFFYISFEYFESENLRKYINDNSIGTDLKKDLIIQLLKGLAYAHRNQIIHRDIKPENILVDKNFNLKIGDFGLALALNDNFVTAQYAIVGTPCYMSPEQVQGKRLTVQSDLFSAGIVALELFTGKNPFLGEDVNKTISNVINYSEKILDELHGSIPDEIRNVISKLLVKDPDLRYRSADEVLIALNVPIDTVIPEKKSFLSNRKILIGSAAAVALISILLLFSDNVNFFSDNSSHSEKVETETAGENNAGESDLPRQNDQPEQKIEEEPEFPGEGIAENKPAKEEINSPGPDESVNNNESENSETGAVKFGSLFVDCLPWAHIFIDDRKLDTTPLTSALNLQAGKYDIKLVHPNYPEYSQTVEIEPDRVTSIKINLNDLFGYLSCKVFPWGNVYLDDEFIGQTPFTEPVKVSPGNHKLVIENPGYPDYLDDLEIAKQETIFVQVNLNEIARNASKYN